MVDSNAEIPGLTPQEQRLFDLTNLNRIQAGLAPLAINMDLVRLARMKSQDMVDNNYFDHRSPTYGLPPAMVRKVGLRYHIGVGENIVDTTGMLKASLMFMTSPSHKANVLRQTFTDVGIGVVRDGRGGWMATQLFIGK